MSNSVILDVRENHDARLVHTDHQRHRSCRALDCTRVRSTGAADRAKRASVTSERSSAASASQAGASTTLCLFRIQARLRTHARFGQLSALAAALALASARCHRRLPLARSVVMGAMVFLLARMSRLRSHRRLNLQAITPTRFFERSLIARRIHDARRSAARRGWRISHERYRRGDNEDSEEARAHILCQLHHNMVSRFAGARRGDMFANVSSMKRLL